MTINSALQKLLLNLRPNSWRIQREQQPERSQTWQSSMLWQVFARTWDLGITSFGGPPVHFHIFHRRFVEQHKWIDEQAYQELFAVCQALPGPASTKLGYCITLAHAGFPYALLSFALWCLPGAIGMFFLAIGVSQIGTTLPSIVYALLSGLNSATVGIVALAAVQLSERATTDQISRAIIIGSASAGLCYSALWYYPMLVVIGAFVTVIWDVWGGRRVVIHIRNLWKRRNHKGVDRPSLDVSSNQAAIEMGMMNTSAPGGSTTATRLSRIRTVNPEEDTASTSALEPEPSRTPSSHIGVRIGIIIAVLFFVSFIIIMTLRSVLSNLPVEFRLFSNLYLAGTIIFGGGPVVIPLLREYIVTEGWVSSRDFLIGLALIQAFPGPNFNFAVYLAALASGSTKSPSIVTAILGFIGIFVPGIALATAASAIWRYLRRYQTVTSLLRGVNAAAVGLVWTAVYRLWEIGYLTETSSTGISLSREPWWVVTATLSFAGNRWFSIPAPVAILSGGIMGIAWWGVVSNR